MARPRFIRIQQSGAADLSSLVARNFDLVEEGFRPLESNPLLDGILHEGITLTGSSADNLITHKLGRSYRGWLLVKGSINGDYPEEATSPNSSLFLNLKVTSAQTVSVWVF